MEKIFNKKWVQATIIRCIRTFFSTILGIWTAGTLITDIDWKTALLAAVSSTIYILIACIVADLPEVGGDAIEDKSEE